ncbi:DNA gyrase/topoisomerase IV subunit A [Lachnoclostridium sp. Marseille-P6806]|uniref:DNA gyrase/topoisomerase IV subunit A n=1 Tax=Lachnoclostridium sp. Marseille-P6806 TaxID=2364793 RepID=UPI00102FD10D|nr:DNA topoisomerase (ATP-hydrolyzing) [Lachnoclostridium sp. Marseille-P6806]
MPVKERIIRSEYSELMQKSYIDYAMSVIVARALPDIRDGLKPVQRRTLYDMSELGIRSDKPYRKSARIVGDTMGKYHPHGDSSIYDCLVVMAQDFKKGLPLVDGHGNFGNIEGDGAAAMRYTEARLQKITEEAFLADLDKDVVDFVPNFDETEKEPSVLPVRIPNFLVNGSEGIAVGMATSTPPHNLGEVIDAENAYLENPDITTAELMKYIKGPDFPTGGIIVNEDDLAEIYETGTGKIRVRGRVTEEKGKNGHIRLVITEIPYPMVGAGIGKFLQDVAELSESRVTGDIIDITNQSSKEGIRIVIELKKDTDVENFKNLLYTKTRLEDTFGVNMLAIHRGRPETMNLRSILQASVEFQFETQRRKYTNLLEREQKKREIQEGLIKACNVIDLIIEILRGSKDRPMAKRCLTLGETEGVAFKSKESRVMAQQLLFTEAQADAILDMRLYKLIGLELNALIEEHEQTVANIYRYEDILEQRESMTMVIQKELAQLRRAYARERRTEITQKTQAVFVKKEQPAEDVWFLMDRFGYARTVDTGTYERNRETIEAENRCCFRCRSDGRICLFTEDGQLHTAKVCDLPLGKLRDKGVPIDNVSNFDSSKEQLVFVTGQSEMNLYRLIFVTRQAMVKIVPGGEFDVRRMTVAATNLREGDRVARIEIYSNQQNIVLQTEKGLFLKFPVEQIPEKKKGAVGARGMKLGDGDEIEAVYFTNNLESSVIRYRERELALNHLKLASRDGKGTKVRA